MFNSLVSKSIAEKNLHYLEKFPQVLLSPKEVEFVQWLTEYQAKHSDIPTPDRIDKTEFGIYLTDHMVSSPITDLYAMSLASKREQFTLKRIRDIQLEIDQNPELIPTQEIIDLGFQLSGMYEDKTLFLSEFNRDDLYSDEPPKRVKFGFDIIDDRTGGLQAGEFGLIVARPETGKTWLTNFISHNVVTGYGYTEPCGKVLYISAEMTPERIVARMDAIAGGFNSKILRTKSNKSELKEARKKADEAWTKIKFMGGEFVIPKLGLITPQNVLDLINTHKPDLVVCDAMYRFVNSGSSGVKDWRSDAEIVRSIANISRITNTPILGTTQLTRNSGKGDIDLSEISFTDSYGQEASIVLSAYNMPSHPNSIIINTIKSRDGNKGGNVEIKISFNTSSYKELTFENLEEK